MARLSRRFSRYFLRRSAEVPSTTSTSPRIDKTRISKPILSERETQSLICSSQPAQYTHTHSSSQYTISDDELRALEEEKLSRRRLEDAIDDILASYQGTATSPPPPPPPPKDTPQQANTPTSPFADPSPRGTASAVDAANASPTPSSSSVYSSPPPTPPTISAKLERFRDTPPPAPGWEKVSFGRQTKLFGPEGFVDFDGGGEGRGKVRVVGMGVDMGRGGKDWRGEFGRRGYAVL